MNKNRHPLISGNWKMNHNHFEAIRTVQRLAYNLSEGDHDAVDISVHPPYTDLRSVQTVLEADDIPIRLGAQNCHWEMNGAFTGETSSAMLAKLNVSLVILGHSERRHLFAETDAEVNMKIHAVLKQGMTPIVCVGESLEEREGGEALKTLKMQLEHSLAGVKESEVSELVVAYEPVWAIGTGKSASPEDAQEMCAEIRLEIEKKWSKQASEKIRIQYGGSVKPVNAPDLMNQKDIDGLLVGGASLDPDEFARIISYRLVS